MSTYVMKKQESAHGKAVGTEGKRKTLSSTPPLSVLVFFIVFNALFCKGCPLGVPFWMGVNTRARKCEFI